MTNQKENIYPNDIDTVQPHSGKHKIPILLRPQQ